jgi:hypothetical protein
MSTVKLASPLKRLARQSCCMVKWAVKVSTARREKIMAVQKKAKSGARKKKGESLKQIYARLRKEFTVEDLLKYLEVDEPTVPFSQVIGEMKEIHRKAELKRKKR